MDIEPDLTGLISRWQAGDSDAKGELFDAIYARLHGIAAYLLRTERSSATLSPTGLVHDAYLRLIRAESIQINNSRHLELLFAQVMRNFLVDRAKARLAAKRNWGERVEDGAELIIQNEADADEILRVHEALTRLEEKRPSRLTKLVQLKYFAEHSWQECADILGVSERTVHRDWDEAKLRLRDALDGIG